MRRIFKLVYPIYPTSRMLYYSNLAYKTGISFLYFLIKLRLILDDFVLIIKLSFLKQAMSILYTINIYTFFSKRYSFNFLFQSYRNVSKFDERIFAICKYNRKPGEFRLKNDLVGPGCRRGFH